MPQRSVLSEAADALASAASASLHLAARRVVAPSGFSPEPRAPPARARGGARALLAAATLVIDPSTLPGFLDVDQYDVVLTDVAEAQLFGVLSQVLGFEYLADATGDDAPWPVAGVVYGPYKRLFVSAVVAVSGERAPHASRPKRVHFVVTPPVRARSCRPTASPRSDSITRCRRRRL